MKIKEPNKPTTTLDFVDLDLAKSGVLSSLRSPGSRPCYGHPIEEFIGWYCSEPRLRFNRAVVTRYRMHLESRGLGLERSTLDSPLFAGSHMKPLTADY